MYFRVSVTGDGRVAVRLYDRDELVTEGIMNYRDGVVYGIHFPGLLDMGHPDVTEAAREMLESAW